jgi:hypothetical protein
MLQILPTLHFPLNQYNPTGNSALAIAGIAVAVGATYAYFSGAKSAQKWNPGHWDWTSASTISSVIVGFAKGVIATYSIAGSGLTRQTFKQLGSKVTRKAAFTTLAVVSAEIAVEITSIFSIAFDLDWLQKLSLGLSFMTLGIDFVLLSRQLQWSFSNPFDFGFDKIDFNIDFNFIDNGFDNFKFPEVKSLNFEVSMPKIELPKADLSALIPDPPPLPALPQMHLGSTVGSAIGAFTGGISGGIGGYYLGGSLGSITSGITAGSAAGSFIGYAVGNVYDASITSYLTNNFGSALYYLAPKLR